MTPESVLFPTYQPSIEEASAAAEFYERLNTAFTVVHDTHNGRERFDIPDAQRVVEAVKSGPDLINQNDVARGFMPNEGEQPFVYVKPCHDSFEDPEGKKVESHFARLYSRMNFTPDVLRLLAFHEGATQPPDSRGYYISRSPRGVFDIFKIVDAAEGSQSDRSVVSQQVSKVATASQVQSPDILPISVGVWPDRPYQVVQASVEERAALLEELEKSAAVLSDQG